MTTIEIDDDVLAELHRRARPFVDTPNDVLRRSFGIDTPEATAALDEPGEARPSRYRGRSAPAPRRSQPNRAQASVITPQSSYRRHIIAALEGTGGRARSADVLAEVERQMVADGELKPADHETVANNEPRWRNLARWERKEMVADGILSSSSRHGWWELA